MIGNLLAGSAPDYLNDPNFWSPVFAGGTMTTAGEWINPETALTLPAYMAAVRNIAEDVAKTPIKVHQQLANDDRMVARDHPVHALIHTRPNPYYSPFTFKEVLTHYAMSWGNGYARIEKTNGGQPYQMTIIHPSLVEVKFDADGNPYYRLHPAPGDSGEREDVDTESMLHIRGFGSEYTGISLARYMADAIGLGSAQQRFASAFFGNGANFGTLLEYDTQLNPEEYAAALRRYGDAVGAKNAFKFLIVDAGMKVSAHQPGIPPSDAQLVESRQFSIEDICRALRIAPSKVQHWVNSHYNNMEAANRDHLGDTLVPWFTRWEEEIDHKLLGDGSEYYAKFIVRSLLLGDLQAQTTHIQQMLDRGVYSINDVRTLYDLNSIGEDGDKRFVQQNMQLLSDAGMEPEPEPALPPPEQPREENAQSQHPVIAAHVPVLTGLLAECETKERRAIDRAKAKHGEDLAAWASQWYSARPAFVRNSLEAACNAAAQMASHDSHTPWQVQQTYASIINQYVAHREQVATGQADAVTPGHWANRICWGIVIAVELAEREGFTHAT